MSVSDHHRQSPASVSCAVITVSDTRTRDTDTSGQAIVALLEAAGHHVVSRTLVPDDPSRIGELLEAALAADDVQVGITTGGTGIGRQREGRGLLLQKVKTVCADRQQRQRQEEEDCPDRVQE